VKKNLNANNRRHFLKQTSVVALIPATALISSRVSAEDAMVDPESAVAEGLKYIEMSEVDAQNCGNCALYSNGDGEKGNCPLFQGVKVGEKAWCSAWAAKS